MPSTAWQMVFDHGRMNCTKRVLVQGAAGNVGAYALQLAKQTRGEVIGTAFTRDVDYVRILRTDQVIDVNGSFRRAGKILVRAGPTGRSGKNGLRGRCVD